MPHLRVGPRTAAARQRRAAQAARRRSLAVQAGLGDRIQEILAGILNISSEGIVVADENLRIVLFSKGAEVIFGHSADEVIGRPLERLIPTELRAAHRRHTDQFAAGPQQSRRMNSRAEILGVRKDGMVLPLEVGLSKLSTPSGLMFTAIVRDISERRRAESALEEAAAVAQGANLAKSAFLAAMSHEIRTPLNGVLGMAQAMAMEDGLTSQQRERLSVIRQSGESLLAILNDLLDLSKIEAGRLDLEETEFDIDEVAQGAHATFAALAGNKGLDFALTVAPGARGVYRGDPLRVRQILHNLISNALKFTDAGSVRVAVGRRLDKLTVTVRDTGIGIPQDKVERLFRKFEQEDASTTRRFGGTGLGLAICRDLAKMMGGSITVKSRPGKGAEFLVELALPRVARAPRKATDVVAQNKGPPLNAEQLRVLVAEDNGMNQLVLKTLMNQFGVDPVMVPNGREAVAAWERERWDVILMDVQMPEMDGPTATEVIRRREVAEGRARTPILALTANAMTHQYEEYRRAGMDGLVAKPIEVEKLYAAVETVLAGRPEGGAGQSGRALWQRGA